MGFEILFAIVWTGLFLFTSYQRYNRTGAGAPKPELYGIWRVKKFTVSGEVQPPLLTDKDRWRRLIIQSKNRFFIQGMRGSFQYNGLQLNMKKKTMVFGKPRDKKSKSTFSFKKPKPGKLKLTGTLNGKQIEASLVRVDKKLFPPMTPASFGYRIGELSIRS